MSGPVDVLASLASLASFGGTIEPKRVRADMNLPRGTGLVANRARWLNGMHSRLPTTATVRRALQRAEREGAVKCVGVGATFNSAWNKNAADCKEHYWVISDAALARLGGAK